VQLARFEHAENRQFRGTAFYSRSNHIQESYM
jgi:hypothetical protein